MHIGLYIGLFLGVFFEGETVLFSAVIAVQHEHMPLAPVMITSFIASVLADIFFFGIGRSKGAKWLSTRKAFQKHTGKAQKFLNKNRTVVLLTYRFMLGIRTILPMMVAINGYPFRKFVISSIIGSSVWVVTITLLGVLAGEAIIGLLDHVNHIEFYIIGALLILAMYLGVRRYINSFANVNPLSWEDLRESD